MEITPKGCTCLEKRAVEAEGRARLAVGPHDTLIRVHREQQRRLHGGGNRDRENPRSAEGVSKHSFFDGSCRVNRDS